MSRVALHVPRRLDAAVALCARLRRSHVSARLVLVRDTVALAVVTGSVSDAAARDNDAPPPAAASRVLRALLGLPRGVPLRLSFPRRGSDPGLAGVGAIAVIVIVDPDALLPSSAGLAFSSRLSALGNFLARAATANAFASTLGGGAFLCRHIGLAARAAQTQMRIALSTRDARLFDRARLHVVYIAVATGRWRGAARLLRDLLKRAELSHDHELLRMVGAARSHCANARRLSQLGAMRLPAAHFVADVTMKALGDDGVKSGGSALKALYERDPAHYDELHRLRLTDSAWGRREGALAVGAALGARF